MYQCEPTNPLFDLQILHLRITAVSLRVGHRTVTVRVTGLRQCHLRDITTEVDTMVAVRRHQLSISMK